MDIEKVIKDLTLEEKVALVAGNDFMFTNCIPRLGIPTIGFSDGPHGVRKQKEGSDNGVTQSLPATCFPTAVLTACTWNKDIAYRIGKSIAEECLYYDVSVILGPGTNIKRNPLCGRNFEYFSEDPILSGVLATSYVKGCQSKNVGVSLKHFAINNQENYRFNGNSVCDERTMREIYLKPFEMVVKNASPYSLMCSYNQINGTFACDNKWLLTDILRNEWGFNGLVMSDWGATYNRVEGIKAGLDLEMPGDLECSRRKLIDAIEDNTLSIEDLDKSVKRVLELIDKSSFREKSNDILKLEHYNTAVDAACEGAVLLKNINSLPLNKEKICVIGELFENMRYQGSGSSMINPCIKTSPLEAFDNHNIDYVYARGYDAMSNTLEQVYIEEALDKSKGFDKVLMFIGLTDLAESEGGDRLTMSLPENQLALIERLILEGKQIDVVFFSGSPVELPFEKDVNSILYMGLPGEGGGEAVYRLLFGLVNPSGKLAETWPIKYNDVLYHDEYSKKINELYKESIYVGYRYYQSFNKDVLYPFGYGLSYSSFKYEKMSLNETEEEIIVNVYVTNMSDYDGKEVVELFVSSPSINLFRPKYELKTFEKVLIKAHETKEVELSVKKDDLRYFNYNTKKWNLENGEYTIYIGKNVNDLVLKSKIWLNGINEEVYSNDIVLAYKNPSNISNEIYEKLIGKKLPVEPLNIPLTMETPFILFKRTFFGKIMYNSVTSVSKKQLKKGLKMKPGIDRDNTIKGAYFLQKIFDTNCLRTLSTSSGGALKYNIAELMCDISNGHIIKGLKRLKNEYKVGPLPKEKKENE